MTISLAKSRIALATSGLGTAFGGIGVVAADIREALTAFGEVDVWRHRHNWMRAARQTGIAFQALSSALRGVDLVVYEHIDLARLHAYVPGLRHRKYCVFLHGTEVWRSLSSSRRNALKLATLRVSNSAFTAAEARLFHPWLGKVVPTELGVRDQESFSRPSEEPIALIVGRMSSGERYKGHDAVLDGWPAIRAAVPTAQLCVLGGGDDLARLRERARGLPGVQFLGPIPDRERDEWYRRARLLLAPSLREGFGLSAAEAAVMGIPVIGLRGTVIEEILPPGVGSVLVPSQTGEAIASAAIPLLRDATRARELGELGRQRIRENFLKEHFVARFRAAIRPILTETLEGATRCAE